MDLPRSSGILLHPTSLPGPFGIGDMGPEAYRFADFLAETGQSWWQILPLGPAGYGNSPYMCFSALGGSPVLISPELLVEEGLLDPSDIANPPAFPKDRVDYGPVIDYKMSLLERSYRKFKEKWDPTYPADFFSFCEQNAFWLEDYVLFRALKADHDERVWTTWEKEATLRDSQTLVEFRGRLSEELQFGKYLEYIFIKQWQALRNYCHQKGINVIGDLPIYVAHDSAEVWANKELFYLDSETGEPIVVGGVPPDYFSATGQRWGNPLYRWDVMAQDGYQWWVNRFRTTFALVDLVRLDHFRGFEAYWEIPASESTAVNGQWEKGPGAVFFESMLAAISNFAVIVEDLGVITLEVDALRDQFGFPGMRILQMAFGNDPKAPEYRPHSHIRNCVAYTATHDHNTTVGWFTAEPGTETTQTREEVEAERRYALEYLRTDGSEIHWDFIRVAMSSVANLCVFPLQDVFGLGSKYRMNTPGTTQGNWEWRFTKDMITPEIKVKLANLTRIYERDPKESL